MKKFCAHRGLSHFVPENTMPAFAAAVVLGADEIEFDVRLTKDLKLIVSHDGELERISDGKGNLSDYTLDELKKLNIGLYHGWEASFCSAEDVFKEFGGKVVFNMHLKEHGEDGYLIKELLKLAKKYDVADKVYFAGSPEELYWMEKLAPEIPRVAIQLPEDTMEIIDMAKKYHCVGVQFWFTMFDEELINKVHKEGLFCNLFYGDSVEHYNKYFGMGIDTILTNRMDIAAKYDITEK